MTATSPASHPQPVWYIQAAGRVWGPYPHGRLADFLAEGRLTPHSLVGAQPGGPFSPAERRRDLRSLFAPTMPEGAETVEPLSPHAAPHASPNAAAAPARAMLVWADLFTLTPQRFEAVLAGYGPFIPIRAGLWLVQARMGPSALRNALSRRLRSEDALLVLQAPLDQVAWFNLAPQAERDLRQLWSQPS